MEKNVLLLLLLLMLLPQDTGSVELKIRRRQCQSLQRKHLASPARLHEEGEQELQREVSNQEMERRKEWK